MHFYPLRFFGFSILKSTTYFILILLLSLSIVLNIEASNGNDNTITFSKKLPKVPEIIEVYEIPFLDEFMSLALVTEPSAKTKEHSWELNRYNPNRQPIFDELVDLYQIWVPRMNSISNSIQVIYTLISKYQHIETRTNSKWLIPEAVRLIDTIDLCLGKLKYCISNPELSRLTEKILSNNFELFSHFSRQIVSVNSHQIDQFKLFNTLLSVSIVYKYIILLEPTFSALKCNIDKLKAVKNDRPNFCIVEVSNPIHDVEKELEKIKKLTAGIIFSQDLYLNIYSLLKNGFNKKDVKEHRKACIKFKAYMRILENIEIYKETLKESEVCINAAEKILYVTKETLMEMQEIVVFRLSSEHEREAHKNAYRKAQQAYQEAELEYQEALSAYGKARKRVIKSYEKAQEFDETHKNHKNSIGCSII